MGVRSLSATEARIVLALEAEGADEVDLNGIRQRAKVSAGFARKLAHQLVRKRWLQPIARGRYLLNPSGVGPERHTDTDPLRLGSRIVSPYYFGFATAAELQGLLPQAGRVYYLVTPRRATARVAHFAEFRTVRVLPRRFFGTRPLERRGESIVVSDLERTVLDCLWRPDLAGGMGGVVQIVESARSRLRWARLAAYLRRFGLGSLPLRLGFLLEFLGDGAPAPWRRRFAPRADDPFVPLGPPKEFGRRGPRDPRWHVIRNVPDAVLRAEVDIR